MNTIQQKTEYWMIGALQRFIYAGIVVNFKLREESKLEDNHVNWEELDSNFFEWADQQVFLQIANKLLNGMSHHTKEVIITHLAAFVKPDTRQRLMQSAYNLLIEK